MASPLARLRSDLDFMPSPVEGRPGLLIRDSLQYSDAVLIIPPPLVQALRCFDGEQTEADLQEMVGDMAGQMVEVLGTNGFLEDDTYHLLRETKRAEFRASPLRMPAHAGSAYPEDREELHALLAGRVGVEPAVKPDPLGIAAPHISPVGGWDSYRAAYAALDGDMREKTFVILGTSHYGEPDKFGLTRKPFVTPLGETAVASQWIDRLASQRAAVMEDYCHSIEHSIEFQVMFLQWRFGPGIRILPILCGSYARSIYRGGKPEADESVARFLDALGELHAREKDRLMWVLGIDMAHMGRRYGDDFLATANAGRMAEVALEDGQRIECINGGDADGFWELVQRDREPLKWCGSSPLYTFLKAVPEARGTLRHYEQWNIDEQSVVSFAGMAFHSRDTTSGDETP